MSEGSKNVTRVGPHLPLNDGYDIPLLGLVAFRVDPDAKLRETLLTNLDAGIRHVEVSELFGNGHVVVDCVTEGNAELLREEVFFTMKIWPKERKQQDLVDAAKDTLLSCGLDYVDLIIIHGPLDIENRLDQYKALEQLKNEGFAHSIGVANMTHSQLSNILKKATIVPAVVEMEITPFHQRGDVAEFCIDNGIIILSDNPLSKDFYSARPDLVAMAAGLDLTVQQVRTIYFDIAPHVDVCAD
jgi:methylglyoxal/glyoxal reductase